MVFRIRDRVRETTITTGTGPITTAGSPPGFVQFGNVMSVGDTCWYAIVMPGTAWETGTATYTGANTLARTNVYESSSGSALVNFPVGSKDIFICQPASQAQAFPSGTLMLFQQSAAPTYWTKQTTFNDYALRIVSGAASSGGSAPFSTVAAQTTTQNFTNTIGTIASHGHSVNGVAILAAPNNNNGGGGGTLGAVTSSSGTSTQSAGLDGAHNHGINLNVAYVDVIICSKD
jgi:hypothetical protein